MDNTKVPRPLIYRERRSLEEFFDNSPLNETLVDNMSNVYYMQQNFKERALKCMNTAYYICTLMLREKHPEWSFNTYCELAFCENKDIKVHQAVTLSLVSIYINGLCEEQRQKLQKLKKQLNDFMNSILHFVQYGDPFLNDCRYSDILEIMKSSLTYYSIDGNEFAFRIIDKEAVRDVMAVKSFNWVTFVDYYREIRVRELVDYYGCSEDEKHNVVDILRQAANGFYSMGFNDKPEQVNKMLDTIEDEIHCHYNSEAEEKLSGADSVEVESMADSVNYEARIKELEAEIIPIKDLEADLEELRKWKHLSRKQVALFCHALAEYCKFVQKTKKDDIAPMAHELFGIGKKSAYNLMVSGYSKADREHVAKIFEVIWPEFANFILTTFDKKEQPKEQ